jgi:pimeloyl-ACP methyl ester carboxylesterase
MGFGRPAPRWVSLAALILACPLWLAACQSARTSSSTSSAEMQQLPNLPLPTMGGRQLWADVRWYAGWRVQQHVWTEHCRLLDEHNVRRAWGSLESCDARLDAERRLQKLTLRSDHLVVLLHGLGRSRSSMADLHQALLADGYEVADIGYPSTRHAIAEHAEQIHAFLNQLALDGGIKKISFVTHSLGGMVARAVLTTPADWQQSIEVHRLLMLAPPSNGSAIAESLKNFLPFQWLLGESGQNLTLSEAYQIAAPNCRFAIIAANRGQGKGWNPGLQGEDDGVVRVEEARLEGSEDFWLVESLHSFIMDKPEVIAASLHYLRTGHLQPEN